MAKAAAKRKEERPTEGAKDPTRRTTRDAAATRGAILSAAIAEFARDGFGGARVDKICRRAAVNERMLYHYFGSKELLFRSCIEKVYEDLVTAEASLELDGTDPREAMRSVIAFTWNYYRAHPELISLLNTENLHGGVHVRSSERIEGFASPQIRITEDVLRRGVAAGLFRQDVTAVELLVTIMSICYFPLSNRWTLAKYLRQDIGEDAAGEAWLDHATRLVLDFLGSRATLGSE